MKSRDKIIILGNENDITSTVRYTCDGCRCCLIIKIDWKSGYDYDTATQEALKLGWHRREFHPEVNPWFCSSRCAVKSSTAISYEKYWKETL